MLSARSSYRFARTFCSGVRPQDLGWSKPCFYCWIYWFRWNTGMENLWDMHMDSSPVAIYKIHEHLRPKCAFFPMEVEVKKELQQKLAKVPAGHENSSSRGNNGGYDLSSKILHLARR
ncbi:hypothetical protein ACFX14_038908 [Malus domestica]